MGRAANLALAFAELHAPGGHLGVGAVYAETSPSPFTLAGGQIEVPERAGHDVRTDVVEQFADLTEGDRG